MQTRKEMVIVPDGRLPLAFAVIFIATVLSGCVMVTGDNNGSINSATSAPLAPKQHTGFDRRGLDRLFNEAATTSPNTGGDHGR